MKSFPTSITRWCSAANWLILFYVAVRAIYAGQAGTAPGGLRTITSAHEAHSLSLSEARRAYPIHLRGVATYYDPVVDSRRAVLFIHDSTGSIFVSLAPPPAFPVPVGSLVDVTGVSSAGDFAPIVDRGQVRVVGEAKLPAEAPLMGLSHLLTGMEDGQWVAIEGVVHSARRTAKGNIVYQLATAEGNISVITLPQSDLDPAILIDAKVRMRGNIGPEFNRLRQMTGVHLSSPGLQAIRVEEAAPKDPFLLPVTDIAGLLRFDPNLSFRHRVHLRGRVTMFWPGRSICIQDATQGLCAQTAQTDAMKLGDMADLIGFPKEGNFGPILTDTIFRPKGDSQAERATAVAAEDMLKEDHEAQLVQVVGKVMGGDQRPPLRLCFFRGAKLYFRWSYPTALCCRT